MGGIYNPINQRWSLQSKVVTRNFYSNTDSQLFQTPTTIVMPRSSSVAQFSVLVRPLKEMRLEHHPLEEHRHQKYQL